MYHHSTWDFGGPSPQQQTRMRPGAPVWQRGCSSAAVAQCAPSSQSARLQWASPSVRLRASIRTDLRAARTPPQTLTDTSSARPQQDARGKERACGTAEHFSGEHRPAFKWWVRASERGLCLGLAPPGGSDPDSAGIQCALISRRWRWRWRINPHSHTSQRLSWCCDGVHLLSEGCTRNN